MIPSATFEQIAGHLPRSITLIVVAEAGAGDQAHCRVADRCCVAVAALEAEIGGPADAQARTNSGRCTRLVESGG